MRVNAKPTHAIAALYIDHEGLVYSLGSNPFVNFPRLVGSNWNFLILSFVTVLVTHS